MPKHRGLVRVSARGSILLGFIAALLLFAGTALAEDKEPSAVVELGGAGEWGLPNGGSRFGPTAAVEFTPIKNWLEIEAGVTPLFGGGHTNWGTDFLFKKPFTLSNSVEFEPGLGPQWSSGKIASAIAFDFMFWPSPDRKIGWFLEPSYSYTFSKDHEQSLGMSVGLLIAIP
jgi:hypothetical protein